MVGWGEGTLEGHTEAVQGSLKDIARRYVTSCLALRVRRLNEQADRLGRYEHRGGESSPYGVSWLRPTILTYRSTRISTDTDSTEAARSSCPPCPVSTLPSGELRPAPQFTRS